MIYELRTYTLKPGPAPDAAAASGGVGREIRGDDYGKLEGYWMTEIGPLNQVMHLWSYADLNERARIRKRLKPAFRSSIYGQPDYARLDSRAPEEIRAGGEDGSEMGCFSHLMEPQREANVREAVRRYLPFGLQMNILYADEETQS